MERTDNLPSGYRMTELGPLPEEWRVVRLGEVCKIGHKSQDTQLLNKNKIPFIPMSLIPEENLFIKRWEIRTINRVKSGILVRNGDLLLAKITPSFENGKQGILKDLSEEWGYATTEVYPIWTDKVDIIDIIYLAFYLKQPKIRSNLASKMEGTTGRQRLPKHVLKSFPIPLPPLPEQKAIAYVLRTVQSAKEATEKVISSLQELKKSLMKHLFTYGPVPVDEREKVELREAEKDTGIGKIPAHWKVVRLGEVAELTMGQSPPSSTYNTHGEVLPFLQGKAEFGDIYPRPVKWCFAPIRIAKRGSVLISVRAPVGDVNLAQRDYCIGRGLAALTGKQMLNNDFLFYFLLNAKSLLEEKGTGSTFKSISKLILQSFPIPLPPLEEQHQIARILQTVDQKIEAEKKRKEALENLFKSLLHNLMTAKVRLPREFVKRFEDNREG